MQPIRVEIFAQIAIICKHTMRLAFVLVVVNFSTCVSDEEYNSFSFC